jgi:glycosyltransferase involved in cell wall biosynthesis
MKYLAVLPRIVFPADTGAKIRNLNMFSRLSAKGDQATIVCYRNQIDSEEDVEKMRQICTRLELVPWQENIGVSKGALKSAARNLFSRYPYSVDKYTTEPMVDRIRSLLAAERYDALVVDTLFMAKLILSVPHRPPSICFQHNVEYIIRQRQFEKARNPLAKAFFGFDGVRMKWFEGNLEKWFDHLIMVSEVDCKAIGELGVHNTSAVPLGVDVDEFSPAFVSPTVDFELPNPATDLVFTGSMDWLPNEDGLLWFVSEVLPLLQREHRTRLWIVGRRPTKAITAVAQRDPNVIVTGWVADVRPYIANAAVYIVPLRIGGGTRIKIFEAMAMGKAVVSTTIGAEGLPVTSGKDIELVDEPQAFAERISELLTNRARAAELGSEARALVEAKYSWANAADVFADICKRVVETKMGKVVSP